jgi:hypothetical protein
MKNKEFSSPINIEGKEGVVLAVAKYADRQSIFFLVKGEKIGRWIPMPQTISSPSPDNHGSNILNDWKNKISDIAKSSPDRIFDKYKDEVEKIRINNPNSTKKQLTFIVLEDLVSSVFHSSGNELIHKMIDDIKLDTFDLSHLLNNINPSDILSPPSDFLNESTLKNIQNSLENIFVNMYNEIGEVENIFKTYKYTNLLIELIYKIGYIYEYDHRPGKLEFIPLLAIALSSSVLKAKLDTITLSSPIPSQVAFPLTNVLGLIIVGCIFQYYYQSQSSSLISKLVTH